MTGGACVERRAPQDGNQLSAEQERFKHEHLQEVEKLRTKDGVWLDIGVLYTIGTKPSKQ
jgi:hypothetical protein